MPQIFHRSFNTLSRLSIFGAVFILAGLGWAALVIARSPYSTGEDVALEQPVPFSHEHHVGHLGIDCRYCHTSVEESWYAGMPSTKTCMNCHSQIWVGSDMLAPVRESYRTDRSIAWQRVHNVPDFTYFDHSIHVKKGVGCASCHGRVDQMPLMWQEHSLLMEWCLDCHRHPERHVRPRDEVFNMAWQAKNQEAEGRDLVAKHKIENQTHCSTCHR
jgi:hypothetical protein